MKRTFVSAVSKRAFVSAVVSAVLLAGVTLLPAVAHAQTAGAPAAESPEAVVRGFYDWYLGSLSREDYGPLRRRREALRFLTPQFHRQAPRIIAREMVDIFICAQDWQPEWAERLSVSAGPARGPRALVTATFDYGPESRVRVRLTLVRAAGAWRINGADCGE